MLRREFLLQGVGCLAGALAVSAPRPSGAAASRLDRVNIIGTAATTNLVLASLLDRMGYLQHFGLEPRIVNVADGNKVVAALISGEVDICPLAGFTQVLAAVARGAPLKVIGGGANKNFSAVFTRLPTARTLKDLEGHSVGVGALGTQLHQIMLALFRKYGVDASKVTFANIGASVDVFKAVKAGIVDAGPAEVWLPHGAELHILEHGKVYESLPEFLSQTAFTSTRAIAQRRDILVRTLAAYARLYRFVMSPDSQPDFIAAGLRALGPRQLDLVHAQWQLYQQIRPFAADLVLTEASIAAMQQLNLSTGTQAKPIAFAALADMSLARDALQLAA